jgi:hypothetical protein
VKRWEGERRRLTTFMAQAALPWLGPSAGCSRQVPVPLRTQRLDSFKRAVDRHPFVPRAAHKRDERCREIFSIQVAALAKRVEHTGAKKNW